MGSFCSEVGSLRHRRNHGSRLAECGGRYVTGAEADSYIKFADGGRLFLKFSCPAGATERVTW